MAIHPDFPPSPYEILNPRHRWFPTAKNCGRPPVKSSFRRLSRTFGRKSRNGGPGGYAGASATSRALLAWWFLSEHLVERADETESEFRYYFAQREAAETVIWGEGGS